MSATVDTILDLIYGRWRSQILYAGVALRLFDHLGRDYPRTAETVAGELKVAALLYRLMRALASLGLLVEDASRGFVTSQIGSLFRSDDALLLCNKVLVAECAEHYAIWRHLPDIVTDGTQSGFIREFGVPAFEYARRNQRYRQIFDQGMTGHSAAQSKLVIEALKDCDVSSLRSICDVGGGQGYLICALLETYPHLTGFVLDLPEVFADPCKLWATKLGLEARCAYVAGDMFTEVPKADAYCLKLILHDWSDQKCVQILSNIRGAASVDARLLIIEHIVPSPNVPHFANLLDIHMMCWGTGRERTEDEYIALLESAGWTFRASWYPRNRTIGIIEGSVPS